MGAQYFDLKEARTLNIKGASGRYYLFTKGKPILITNPFDVGKFNNLKNLLVPVINGTPQPASNIKPRTFRKMEKDTRAGSGQPAAAKSGVKEHKCEMCPAVCKTKQALASHMRNIHGKGKQNKGSAKKGRTKK